MVCFLCFSPTFSSHLSKGGPNCLGFFSNQMCPQMASLRRGKVTVVAFVWLFSTVYLKNESSKRLQKRIQTLQSHTDCTTLTFLHSKYLIKFICYNIIISRHLARIFDHVYISTHHNHQVSWQNQFINQSINLWTSHSVMWARIVENVDVVDRINLSINQSIYEHPIV